MTAAVRGVVAIIRLRRETPTDDLLDCLVAGGIRTLEVTLPTPGSTDAVRRWLSRHEVTVGVGTVRTRGDAERALEAGAQFLVSPTVREDVLELTSRAHVPLVCGAATPTEIDLAWSRGAAVVKVFPVNCLGGESYIRALAGPMPEVPLLPTGGVDARSAGRFAALGCAGVGVGSEIVDEALVARHDWPALTGRARRLTAAWADGTRLR